MSQRRGTITNQLRNVLQVLQMGRKTGILYVEREGEKGLEAGRMTLMQGHITEAQVGQFQSQRALDLLNSWESCRFLFSTERTTQRLPAVSATNPELNAIVKRAEATQRTPTGAPQRLQPIEEALRYLEGAGLSRVHRRLLLLLDGQRRLPELARLMNRREDEVAQLLWELAKHGFIQLA